jgi:hypothetical protein
LGLNLHPVLHDAFLNGNPLFFFAGGNKKAVLNFFLVTTIPYDSVFFVFFPSSIRGGIRMDEMG